jgi:hypothetical protein
MSALQRWGVAHQDGITQLRVKARGLGYDVWRMSGYEARFWDAGDYAVFNGSTGEFVATYGPRLSDLEARLETAQPLGTYGDK